MSEPIEPTPVAPEPQESSTIREMRAKIEQANAEARVAKEQAASLEAALKEKERAEMAELDRIKAEAADKDKVIQDLQAIRDEHGRYASTFEALYAEELQNVPEDKRADVEALTGKGTWAERYQGLKAALKLIPAPATPAVPRIQPGSPSVVTDPAVTPPSKTNAEVAKTKGVFGSDFTAVQYKKATPGSPSAQG